ncbi:hypothetical protein [Phenylobacterium sp.]|uniref:hypothetical protein n=1 Tax=Phenylobacterium sp. TaxID=1871053 RepID=UPI0025F3D117|nr:hypothetical protein [Phenylobacterium sp.]
MSEPSAVQRFFGAALIGVGVLMMLLCGGCGALFFVGFLFSGLTSSNSEDLSFLIMPVVLGGVPALIGFGLFAGGRALRRPTAPVVGATNLSGSPEGDAPP